MGFLKDTFKDNQKIILLTLGLLVLSIVGVFLMDKGMIGVNTDINVEGLYDQPENVIEEGIDYQVGIKTVYGEIVVDLYEEESPNAVNSFLFLAGEDFYDGLTFHRVIKDFIIQGGDNLGDGNGNPGYNLEPDSNNIAVTEYSMIMANGSQFFIITEGADLSEFSDYTVMGKVISGKSVVDSIENVTVDKEYKPINDVTISSVLIIEE